MPRPFIICGYSRIMACRFTPSPKKYLSSTENALVKDILLTLLAHFARLEADKISQRTIAGLQRAREKGKRLGRPSKIDRVLPFVRDAYSDEISVADLATLVKAKARMNVSESTIRRCLKQLTSAQQNVYVSESP